MDRPDDIYQYVLNSYQIVRNTMQLSQTDKTTNKTQHDMMNELLSGVRLKGLEYRRVEISSPFGLKFGEKMDKRLAYFHFIGQGSALLKTKSGAVHQLACGDAVLMPCAGTHDLYSEDGVPLVSINAFEKVQLCDATSEISVCNTEICQSKNNFIFSCAMEFDLGWLHPLAHLKPEVMHIETVPDHDPQIPAILDVMTNELKAKRPGYAVILTRLADVVAAAILRRWVETGCNVCGWVEAMRDHARVISLMTGEVTADDVRQHAREMEWQPESPNAFGAVFRGRHWLCIGRTKSKHPGNHAREIRVWKWVL